MNQLRKRLGLQNGIKPIVNNGMRNDKTNKRGVTLLMLDFTIDLCKAVKRCLSLQWVHCTTHDKAIILPDQAGTKGIPRHKKTGCCLFPDMDWLLVRIYHVSDY